VIKAALGKPRSIRPPAQAVLEGGFRELPISFEHVEAVGALPMYHNDPFDRLILAVAGVEGFTIVTSDRKFARYGVPLIDARD
jgi:PIN domain nuclease of toxin-antitoxin system